MTLSKTSIRGVMSAMLLIGMSGCIKAQVAPLEVKHIYMTLDINIKDPGMVAAMQATTLPTTMASTQAATRP